MALSDAGVIEDPLATAGLTVRGGAEVPIPIAFPTLDDGWRDRISAGPLPKVISTAAGSRYGASSTLT